MEIERICAAWKRSYEKAGLLRTPKLWVGYWRVVFAGSLHMPTFDTESLFYLASPFAMSDITGEAVVLDLSSHIHVSALTAARQAGYRIRHWTVDRDLADDGTIRFRDAQPAEPMPAVDTVLCYVGDTRANEERSWSYDQAFQTAWLLAEMA